MKFETLYTVADVATSKRLSQQTDVTVRDAPSHVWKLLCHGSTLEWSVG